MILSVPDACISFTSCGFRGSNPLCNRYFLIRILYCNVTKNILSIGPVTIKVKRRREHSTSKALAASVISCLKYVERKKIFIFWKLIYHKFLFIYRTVLCRLMLNRTSVWLPLARLYDPRHLDISPKTFAISHSCFICDRV